MKSAKPYQANLFEITPLPEPAVVLDIKLARQLRDEGMDQAESHADQERTNWSGEAFLILIEFLKNHEGEFKVEDVRLYAVEKGFDLPPSNRAWGPIIVRAQTAGLVESFRNDKTRNKTAHRAKAAVWQKKQLIDSKHNYDD